MAYSVICSCCGQRIPVTAADVGRAVVCPTSRRLVMVKPGDVPDDAEARPLPVKRKRGRWLLALLLLLLLAGGLTAWLWPSKQANLVLGPKSNPDVILPDPQTPNPIILVPDQPVPVRPAPITPPDEVAIAPLPRLVEATTVAVLPPVVPVAILKDRFGMNIYNLFKRIDLRSADELQRELLGVREVALDIPAAPNTTQKLFALVRARLKPTVFYPELILATAKREDIASLPYHLRNDAANGEGRKEEAAFRKRDEARDTYSRQFRALVQDCVPPGGAGSGPDPDKLYARLLAGGPEASRDRPWAVPEAVPCVEQILQAGEKDVRRIGVELLTGIDTAASVEALVRGAVFDPDAENRAAAVNSLRTRDRAVVLKLLLERLRYPWPRATEHAAEALVALDRRDAVPDLAAMLALPDPDAPQAIADPPAPGAYRREMVRVNHARNCVMCHSPSPRTTDLVRAVAPDPSRPLPPLTAETNRAARSVTAAIGYLTQDFSVDQPVPDPGPWPGRQSYDYLVAVRKADAAAPADEASLKSAYHEATLWALRELTGKDLGVAAADWLPLAGDRVASLESLLEDAFRLFAWLEKPEALAELVSTDFAQTLFDLDPEGQQVFLGQFESRYGSAGSAALQAYFSGLARSPNPFIRGKASALKGKYWGTGGQGGSRGKKGNPDPKHLAQMLKSGNAAVRAAGAAGLGQIGPLAKGNYKELMQALKDPDAKVRKEAASALGAIGSGPDEMVNALAAATKDPAAPVRGAAAESLGKFTPLPRKAVQDVAEAYVRPNEWDSDDQKTAFEKNAAGALANTGSRGTGIYPVLLRAAGGKPKSNLPPATLAQNLRTFGPPAASDLDQLVELMAKPDYKSVAEDQLLAAGDAAIKPLVKGLKRESEAIRAASADLLGRAASLNRDPPPDLASWRSAMDELANAKATDSSILVKDAAGASLGKLTKRP